VVPYPAGGVVDVVLRAVCDPLSNALPQRIVVDNRPGADGRIGIDAVARAPADGYTLLAASPILTTAEHLMPDSRLRSRVSSASAASPPRRRCSWCTTRCPPGR
jgi:tripartite-type tricarboxylate transporter receptor subunit TctC